MDEQPFWDPVMLEDYLASIELGVDDDQVLELRKRVLDRTIALPRRILREQAESS